ncbi:MAG: hypothetical protein GQ531_09400 [Sulfurovum sp.]|nr:hypothetical protein [Sulfurovum sp.]
MSGTKFSNLFIVMEDYEDAQYVLKNLDLLHTKARIVLLNHWEKENLGKDHENITIVHADSLLAAHLYDQLPNVPLVAQNVGLGTGEIMEVHIPFGSSYAFRHIGSIVQRKWKISAIYRDGKQILPTSATMIKPNDTLLIVGKPLVLDGVYKTINKRIGLFPEPFGKDIYLLLDFRHDKKFAISYIHECLYLLGKLEEKVLHIRIIYPNDFALIDEIKSYESEHVSISIAYTTEDVSRLVEFDIHEYNVGLIINSIATFEADDLKKTLYDLKKLVYLFGNERLEEATGVVILMREHEKMESISATAFDISETLGKMLTLADFDPDGDFESKKMVLEHYETLAHLFTMDINIEQKIANPIRELSKKENVLQIAPFEKRLNTDNFRKFISSKVQDFLLTSHKHPKLLIPFAITES